MVSALFPVNRNRASMPRETAGAQSMHDRHKNRPQDRGHKAAQADQVLIFGVHAVEAALANPQRVIAKLYLTDNAERRLSQALTTRQMAHQRVLPKDLDRRLGPDTVHQG